MKTPVLLYHAIADTRAPVQQADAFLYALTGFDVPALSHYAIEPMRPGLVFGFTAFAADQLRVEFKRIRPILERAAKERA